MTANWQAMTRRVCPHSRRLSSSLDLVGGKVALFGWKKGIGHQSLSPGEATAGRLAAGSSLFRFNHMRAVGFHQGGSESRPKRWELQRGENEV